MLILFNICYINLNLDKPEEEFQKLVKIKLKLDTKIEKFNNKMEGLNKRVKYPFAYDDVSVIQLKIKGWKSYLLSL